MTKLERAEKARKHYEKICKTYPEEIKRSIYWTTTYGPDSTRANNEPPVHTKHSIHLVAKDSVSCLLEEPMHGHVCIVNFASYKHPGGYFLGGSSAQEEALCHESTLYPVLLSFKDNYYAWNMKHLNRAQYLNRALYSESILFERNEKRLYADVLTCAAPNYRTAHTYQNVSMQENLANFKDRIKFAYDIAEEQGVNTLITGAWGCGVFMQPPLETCKLLTNTLLQGGYSNLQDVYFAIPDENSRNFKAFQEVLDAKPRK